MEIITTNGLTPVHLSTTGAGDETIHLFYRLPQK